jgi:hypothetical protein
MTGHAQSAVLLTEGFDNITNLAAGGWSLINVSSPVGTRTWFQGNDGVFQAQSGAASSYIGANWASTGSIGTISNWLMTPVLDLSNPLDWVE